MPCIRQAYQLVRELGGTLTLLTVIPMGASRSRARRALEAQLHEAEQPRGDCFPMSVVIREGASPADEILREAQKIRADLIVLGTHGRRGFDRLRLGSTAEAIVRTAPCPVITVPGQARRVGARALGLRT
jgi:nucleotide-binding universal stress UspA family protein